jgi:hypothetical protein
MCCVQVVAATTFIKSEAMYYPSCTNKRDPTRACQKKLTESGGEW